MSRRTRSCAMTLAVGGAAVVTVAACGKPWNPLPPKPTTTTSSSSLTTVPATNSSASTTTSTVSGTTTSLPPTTGSTWPVRTTGTPLPGAKNCGDIPLFYGWPTTSFGNYQTKPGVKCFADALAAGDGAHLELITYNGAAYHYRVFDVVGDGEFRYTTKHANSTDETVQICSTFRVEIGGVHAEDCRPA